MLGFPLLSFGSVASDAPVLVSVVDGGDQDSAVATVTGTGTIQLYYRIRGTTVWTTGLTRSGDGTITQTGLTADNWYEFYCTADQNGIESEPSNLVTTYIDGDAIDSIERAIRALLTGDSGVEALVSSRVYPNYVPQNAAMPAITYQQISGPRDNSMDGPSGLVHSRFQINSWGTTYSSADEVANAVRLAMSGFKGTVANVVIQGILMDDEGDDPKIVPGTDKLRRLGKIQDYDVHHLEATS